MFLIQLLEFEIMNNSPRVESIIPSFHDSLWMVQRTLSKEFSTWSYGCRWSPLMICIYIVCCKNTITSDKILTEVRKQRTAFYPQYKEICLTRYITFHLYFLFPEPMVRSSKLRSVSSRPPFVVAADRVKDDDLDSNPGWSLWVVERRALLESRLVLLSLGSPEELGLLLDMTTLLEELPFRDKDRVLSESAC